jgi:hypothetical protein
MQGDFILLRKTSDSGMEPVDDVIQFAGADDLEDAARAIIDQTKQVTDKRL